jgi:hypothetical protein
LQQGCKCVILKTKKGGTDRWQGKQSQRKAQVEAEPKHGGVTLYIKEKIELHQIKSTFCKQSVKRKMEVILRKDRLGKRQVCVGAFDDCKAKGRQ